MKTKQGLRVLRAGGDFGGDSFWGLSLGWLIAKESILVCVSELSLYPCLVLRREECLLLTVV